MQEATDLQAQYDIHTVHVYKQHLFIADASGNSVVVEWKQGKMETLSVPRCTNFEVTWGVTAGKCDRFDTIAAAQAMKPSMTVEEAMRLTDMVHLEEEDSLTQWSNVYHMSDFTVDIALDRNYRNILHLSRDDF